jgi:hypothetical protein
MISDDQPTSNLLRGGGVTLASPLTHAPSPGAAPTVTMFSASSILKSMDSDPSSSPPLCGVSLLNKGGQYSSESLCGVIIEVMTYNTSHIRRLQMKCSES